jgi:16S rRNA (cytosine967-C5)-methyltransferase
MARPPHQTPIASAGWQSRHAAGELVLAAMDGKADFDAAMDASRAFNRLQGPDRGFARAMAGAALRGLGRIDWALGGMVQRPLADIEPPLRALLRVGAAQLWMLGVAEHAAVSATVESARQWREARRGGGLVNAVLRRAARERDAWKNAPATSVWPDWLAAKLKSAIGADRADAMALAQLEEPPIDLTLRAGVDAATWAERLGADILPGGSLRLQGGGAIANLPGYAEGAWWVQDSAAALAARLLGDVHGRAVADLCAAPGGKAMQLAAMGAKLFAIDLSPERIARLRQNVERARLPMQIVEADARTWRPAEPLDAVLLDAPCSALGIIRRHPEGVWRRDPRDFVRFPAVQRALVDAAGEMLRPGGRLVYAVCTPTPEEGAEVIEAAIAGGGWRRVAVAPAEAPGFESSLTMQGDVLTLTRPRRDAKDAPGSESGDIAWDADAFFIARLERI